MNKSIYFFLVLLLVAACNKGDDDVSTPPPVVPDPGCDNCPPEEAPGYVKLNAFIGTWHSSSLSSVDGNVISVGRTKNDQQMFVAKTTPQGDTIYTQVFNEINSVALGVYEDDSQHLYVTGYVTGENAGDPRQLSVARLDPQGQVLWTAVYHPEESITGYHVSGLNENELMVSGSRSSDLVLLKIDSLGQELFFEIRESPYYDTSSGMLVLQDGNILITGYNSASEITLSCFDPDASLLWKKSYGAGHRVGRSTIQLEDGNLITVGSQAHLKPNSSFIDFQLALLIKTDAQGEVIWEKEVGDSSVLNHGQSIAVHDDGTFVLTGYALKSGETDHMLIYTDADGNQLNAKYFTDASSFRGQNIVKTPDGRNVISGGYTGGMFLLNVDNYGEE